MASPSFIDPTKAGKYPVILSDALLGKPSKETYTGVRYNHRPTLSSDTAPDTARLKKSSKDESYNLGFDDQGDKYQYNGVRTTDDGNYVLIFDPARKAFVLHRVDSTFHMNITRTPNDSNPESLRTQFPPLEVKTGGSSARQPKGKATDKAGTSKATPTKAKDSRPRAAEGSTKPNGNKPVELTLPDPNAPAATETTREAPSEPEKKPKRRALSPVESEEEDDDDDGGVLTVEYPEGNPAAVRGSSQYMPPFPASVTRSFSQFAIERRSQEDDLFDSSRTTGGHGAELADEEGYEEGDEYEEEDEEEPSYRPRSPVIPSRTDNPPPAVEPEVYTFDDGDEDSDAEARLEAELSKAFDEAQENGGDSDGSVSEEE